MNIRHNIYVTMAVFTFVILILAIFFIWPLLTQIQNNSSTLLSIKNDTAALAVQSDEINSFKKVYGDYKPSLDVVNNSFIDPKNPVDVITFLENSASSVGIPAQITLSPISAIKNQNVVTFQLTSTGSYLQILDFTKKLENGPYLLEIESVSMQNAKDQSTSKTLANGKVDASLVINVFSRQTP